MKAKHTLIALSALLLAAGCSTVPKQAYFNRGDPENLLDASTEVINVRLESEQSINEITDWVNKDQPTRAELYCLESDHVCTHARHVLKQYGVPVTFVAAADNRASLVYERVLARDCENRFVDNHINPYNMNHPVFGCSVSSNMVQQVTDKHQFTNPSLMDYPDAAKTVQTYGRYAAPPPASQTNQTQNSELDYIRSGSN